MRKLLITRGLPGSGKSTLIAEEGLQDHHLSADKLRRAFTGSELCLDGELRIAQKHNDRIWRLMHEAFGVRVDNGEIIALEGRFDRFSEMVPFIDAALLEGYQIHIADLSDIPLEVIQERNKTRPVLEQVRSAGQEADARRISDQSLENWLAGRYPNAGITISDSSTASAAIQSMLTFEVQNFDRFSRVVHIGDLQGVCEALFQEGSPVRRRLDDDIAYVFVGDALDRGLENGEIMKWLVEEVTPRLGKNVWFLRGNHEIHLEHFAAGRASFSIEFNLRTLPQLVEAGITRLEAEEFVGKLTEALVYEFQGKTVYVTHGGIPAPIRPARLPFVPSEQLMKGPGYHSTRIDEIFNASASEHADNGQLFYQVHGHRNSAGVAIDAYPFSFNLEGGAEHGGHIRIAVLDTAGWSVHELRNDIFMHPFDRHAIDAQENRKAYSPALPNPEWLK